MKTYLIAPFLDRWVIIGTSASGSLREGEIYTTTYEKRIEAHIEAQRLEHEDKIEQGYDDDWREIY